MTTNRPAGPPRATTRPLAAAVAALVVGNLVALWIARGHYVGGWELFGPTFGVLTVQRDSLPDALRTIGGSYLAQRDRPGYTGAESFVYTLVPGVLDLLAPWLLWSQLLSLVLFVGFSCWLARRLAIPATWYAAATLASPALTSYAIVGYPYLPSTAIPYGLAIAWVLAPGRPHEGGRRGPGLDILVFAAITAIAYDGYETGKTFFLVPAVAAVTLSGIAPLRRATWLGIAAGVALLGLVTRPMSSAAALAAVPHDLSYLTGIRRVVDAYLVDWYLDFPAIGLATVVALAGLRRRRAFWGALLLAATGLLSLSAFHLDGQFVIPQRFLLLAFLGVLVIGRRIAEATAPGTATRLIALLLAIGAAYTTAHTVRFASARPTDVRRNYNLDRVYPLPYQHARLDWHVWRDRVHDAEILARLGRERPGTHVLFYGFSVVGEDAVNPQVLPSRILLNVGGARFARRFRFFDHQDRMWFRFPIAPLAAVDDTLASLTPPFYVHVKEPEHSAADLQARHLNRAAVARVELGLEALTSFEVRAYRPPGPVPIPPLRDGLTTDRLAGAPAGWCRAAWTPETPGESSVFHPWNTMAARLGEVLATTRARRAERTVTTVVRERLTKPTVVHHRAWLSNLDTRPTIVTFDLRADDELALLVNDRSIVERPRAGAEARWRPAVALPPGVSRVDLLYRKFWNAGGVELRATARSGDALDWRCAGE